MGAGISLNWTAIGVILAILIALNGTVYDFATKDAADARQDKEIAQLQAESRTLTSDLAAIKTSTARIEAKFEILVPTPGDRR